MMCQVRLLQLLMGRCIRKPGELLLVIVDRRRDVQPRPRAGSGLGFRDRGTRVVRWEGISPAGEEGATTMAAVFF